MIHSAVVLGKKLLENASDVGKIKKEWILLTTDKYEFFLETLKKNEVHQTFSIDVAINKGMGKWLK